ncbi:MAG: glycosyltransferase [Pseudomonadota bacterium]
MGAVNFSLDRKLVEALKEALHLDVFVETGTFQGETINSVKDCFLEIHSVELSAERFEEARARFSQANIHLVHGGSTAFLTKLAPTLTNRSTLYFLDAHWCVADNTAGAISQCPLIHEIMAIGRLNKNSLIIIDDARLFLAPPTAPHDISQWPTFNQILEALKSLSENHVVSVINDTILFTPNEIERAVQQYGYEYGIDWLAVTTVFSTHKQLWLDLVAKEKAIQEQAKNLAIAQTTLAYKDEALSYTQSALAQKDLALSKMQLAHAEKDSAIADLQAALAHTQKNLVEVPTPLNGKFNFYSNKNRSLTEVSELEEKEAVIQDLSRAIKAYRMANFILNPRASSFRIISRIKAKLTPRLGNLNQHGPIRLSNISTYRCETKHEQLPMFTIVTPSYNQGHFIERTIQSILEQHYPKIEYVIQDGGSSDQTVSVLKKYEHQLTRWESCDDTGQSQAINRGFKHSTGEIMAWVNSDDILLAGTLAYVADYFIRHPKIDVVYGNRLLIDENDMQIGRWILPGHNDKILSWADYVPQETMFWRRSIWERSGGRIDESFRFAMDWDLLIRFRKAGAKFAHLPRFLGAFRIHEKQKTSAAISEIGYLEMDRIRQQELGRTVTHRQIKKAISLYLFRHTITDRAYGLKKFLGVTGI